jgi:anti-sigma B factor antagonist
MPLRVSPRKVNRLISLHGEIDLSNRDELIHRLTSLMVPAHRRYTLDFAAVTFMDCSGITAVLTLDRHLRDVGGTLRVGAASPQVARVFDLLARHAGFPDRLMPHPAPRRARASDVALLPLSP